MRENIFEIKKLKCAYDKSNVVLEVEHLEIPKGKLVILLGKSGSGKSTFLETLGLMNNTIIEGNVLFYPVSANREAIDIGEIWKLNNSLKTSDIRNRHMSFIFQNTNLMDNLSALENICITQMIQGVDYQQAEKNALKHMQSVGLENINDGRMSINLSGGQKQRVAFVRAISSSYDVLFGDEPTGNLDEFNTCDIMNVLREVIRETGRTAIIVSHNVDVALRFADQVVIIQKNNKNGNGIIHPSNVINSKKNEEGDNTWEQINGNMMNDPKLFVMNAMNA